MGHVVREVSRLEASPRWSIREQDVVRPVVGAGHHAGSRQQRASKASGRATIERGEKISFKIELAAADPYLPQKLAYIFSVKQRNCARETRPMLEAAAAPQKETKMAKEKRRGNREIRKPKAVKSAAAAPVSPFAQKSPSAATTPTKRK